MMRRDTVLAKPGTIQKSYRIVDAENVSLGRLAADVAIILMGKHRPDYTPNLDCGDVVIVTNATKIGLTGRKAEQRFKQRYTGYPSGLKMESYGSVRERQPERLVQDAVRRMLPKNRLARVMLKNLKVFPGVDHPYAAQKPTEFKI
jgi:large subunit ribosomal protein L13